MNDPNIEHELRIFEEALKRCREIQCGVCRVECETLVKGIMNVVRIRAGKGVDDVEAWKYFLAWVHEASTRHGTYRFECELRFEE